MREHVTRMDILELHGSLDALRSFPGSERDPDRRSLPFVADARLRAGDLPGALEAALEAVRLHPHVSSSHLVLARVAEVRADWEQLRKALDAVRRLDPDSRFLPDLERALTRPVVPSDPLVSDPPAPSPVNALNFFDPFGPPRERVAPVAAPTALDTAEPPESIALPTESIALPTERVEPPTEPMTLDAQPEERAPLVRDGAPPALPLRAGGVPQTRTLAELYASQGLIDRAVQVYEALVEQNPGDAELVARLDDLRRDVEEPVATVAAAVASGLESPFHGVPELQDFETWLEQLPILGEAIQEGSPTP
jgi:tetratricopeptide (TPR) repeat protein